MNAGTSLERVVSAILFTVIPVSTSISISVSSILTLVFGCLLLPLNLWTWKEYSSSELDASTVAAWICSTVFWFAHPGKMIFNLQQDLHFCPTAGNCPVCGNVPPWRDVFSCSCRSEFPLFRYVPLWILRPLPFLVPLLCECCVWF